MVASYGSLVDRKEVGAATQLINGSSGYKVLAEEAKSSA